LWLPLDEALIAGPRGWLSDPRTLLVPDVVRYLTGVLAFRGTLTTCRSEIVDVPVVMNLSASTIRHEHTRKVPVGTIADALRAGAQAIAWHINVTSLFESESLRHMGRLATKAEAMGLPVVAMAYPRTSRPDGKDENYLDLRAEDPEAFTELVRHCVRIAVELGASVVKTCYTGSVESFSTVVSAAVGVPVLIAGERLVDTGEAIAKAQSAIRAGAAGVAYGRQIFERSDPVAFVEKLHHAMRDERMDMLEANGRD